MLSNFNHAAHLAQLYVRELPGFDIWTAGVQRDAKWKDAEVSAMDETVLIVPCSQDGIGDYFEACQVFAASSSGRGLFGRRRPGLFGPPGVHRDHRGHGYGRSVTVAAALQEMGSSSATMCTPTSNVGGVATYASGFQKLPDVFRLPPLDRQGA